LCPLIEKYLFPVPTVAPKILSCILHFECLPHKRNYLHSPRLPPETIGLRQPLSPLPPGLPRTFGFACRRIPSSPLNKPRISWYTSSQRRSWSRVPEIFSSHQSLLQTLPPFLRRSLPKGRVPLKYPFLFLPCFLMTRVFERLPSPPLFTQVVKLYP